MNIMEANSDLIKASGIVHLPIELRFSNSTCLCMLPAFACELFTNIDSIFGLDADREIGFIWHFVTGMTWHDDANGSPVIDSLACMPRPQKNVG